MIFVHGSNLEQKEQHRTKYRNEMSKAYLAEIRIEYDKWHEANMVLNGPASQPSDIDFDIISKRVELLEGYKSFLDQQKYAEQFDSRSNLHSSVLEEFLYYLFKDLVADFGKKVLVGKSHAFKDIFFMPPNYKSMLERPHASIEKKDHDFVIGTTIEATFSTVGEDIPGEPTGQMQIEELVGSYDTQIVEMTEKHFFDVPAVVIECKTYLDKTMRNVSMI